MTTWILIVWFNYEYILRVEEYSTQEKCTEAAEIWRDVRFGLGTGQAACLPGEN